VRCAPRPESRPEAVTKTVALYSNVDGHREHSQILAQKGPARGRPQIDLLAF